MRRWKGAAARDNVAADRGVEKQGRQRGPGETSPKRPLDRAPQRREAPRVARGADAGVDAG
eukprot:4610974-Pyramimonas_sp.AAC.1